ncbi:ATP-binding protein [Micromonospora sp. NPDC047644]|uniref:ATP-binding protein n=1 Tax=Micromonospora sp. NPDC047644 TaxID=3157203 RepID=UPI003455EDA4
MVVPHHPGGARLARHRLAAELTDVVPPTILADLIAVLAELVGNAVRHARPLPGGVIRVAWHLRPTVEGTLIQLRVTDGGSASSGPRLRTAGLDAADGRGLHIVAGLATRWGVEQDGMGQRVWAEFDRVPAPRPDLVPAAG